MPSIPVNDGWEELSPSNLIRGGVRNSLRTCAVYANGHCTVGKPGRWCGIARSISIAVKTIIV
jgi:hypothetical protein